MTASCNSVPTSLKAVHIDELKCLRPSIPRDALRCRNSVRTEFDMLRSFSEHCSRAHQAG
jgi:hypothetical protein